MSGNVINEFNTTKFQSESIEIHWPSRGGVPLNIRTAPHVDE